MSKRFDNGSHYEKHQRAEEPLQIAPNFPKRSSNSPELASRAINSGMYTTEPLARL